MPPSLFLSVYVVRKSALSLSSSLSLSLSFAPGCLLWTGPSSDSLRRFWPSVLALNSAPFPVTIHSIRIHGLYSQPSHGRWESRRLTSWNRSACRESLFLMRLNGKRSWGEGAIIEDRDLVVEDDVRCTTPENPNISQEYYVCNFI